MHLILDVHKAQKTEAVQAVLDECSTDTAFIPGGYISLIQPFDVSFNKPFKNAVERLVTEHIPGSVCEYVKGELNLSARRVLFTKWVCQALEDVSAKKDVVVRRFKKSGN